ncbi:MAG: dihydroorotase [Alphaproteobacteria bacterium]|nr:dihydroorotase [Alphaproteobacteria bacterium]
MPENFDLILSGATIVNHDGRGVADVGVRDGRTAAIGDLSKASAGRTIQAKGLHLLPGVIDSQVHFREPGNEHKENLQTGSLAAVMGGVTAVFEMPNTVPATTDAEALADKVRRARGRMHCDFAFYMGASVENAAELGELERLPGCAGVKMFMGASTGSLLVSEDEGVRQVLRHGRRRVAIHSEDQARMVARKHLALPGAVETHPVWRDAESALLSTQRLLRIAREEGRRVHVLHITTAEEISLLAAHKDIASVEVTPQHLTLAAPEAYAELGARAQMNPPIRDALHRAGLWRGVANGVVDVLGSDHAPHTLQEKGLTGDNINVYPNTPSGMPGVQTLVPILLDHVAAGRLSLERFVDLTSHGPNRIFGIANKGRLAVGYDADYTLVDLRAERVIEDQMMKGRSGWTPFHGRKVTGWPMGTIVRGHVVMWDGAIDDAHQGAPIRFQECL